MSNKQAFEKFMAQYADKSKLELLKRIYALTRYAQRVDAFFANPLCASEVELSAFEKFCENYIERRK